MLVVPAMYLPLDAGDRVARREAEEPYCTTWNSVRFALTFATGAARFQ